MKPLKLTVLILLGSMLSSFALDFKTESFSVEDLEKWLTEDLTLKKLTDVFGENRLVSGSLESMGGKERSEEEIFQSIERYIYYLNSDKNGRFSLTKDWTLESPTLSFRFIGNQFLSAFIMNPTPEDFIPLTPNLKKQNKSSYSTPGSEASLRE